MKRITWNKRIAGQIRDCARAHPDYFNMSRIDACVSSLTKRIVGEVMSQHKQGLKTLGNPVPSEPETGEKQSQSHRRLRQDY